MLNGISPILIFSFSPQITQSLFSAFSGVPIVGDLITNIGIPIPIYLDENLTGILVDSETKAIDIDTQTQVRYDGKPPSYDQRGLNSLVTINMTARKDSMMLAVLLAMNDLIFQRVVQKSYKVSYLNGTTTVFNALLHGFSTSVQSDNDLVHVVMQLNKSNDSKPTPANLTSVLPKITGATPVAVP